MLAVAYRETRMQQQSPRHPLEFWLAQALRGTGHSELRPVLVVPWGSFCTLYPSAAAAPILDDFHTHALRRSRDNPEWTLYEHEVKTLLQSTEGGK